MTENFDESVDLDAIEQSGLGGVLREMFADPVSKYTLSLVFQDNAMFADLVQQRLALGATVEDFAEAIGCSPEDIERFERGRGEVTVREIRLYRMALFVFKEKRKND